MLVSERGGAGREKVTPTAEAGLPGRTVQVARIGGKGGRGQ